MLVLKMPTVPLIWLVLKLPLQVRLFAKVAAPVVAMVSRMAPPVLSVGWFAAAVVSWPSSR